MHAHLHFNQITLFCLHVNSEVEISDQKDHNQLVNLVSVNTKKFNPKKTKYHLFLIRSGPFSSVARNWIRTQNVFLKM